MVEPINYDDDGADDDDDHDNNDDDDDEYDDVYYKNFFLLIHKCWSSSRVIWGVLELLVLLFRLLKKYTCFFYWIFGFFGILSFFCVFFLCIFFCIFLFFFCIFFYFVFFLFFFWKVTMITTNNYQGSYWTPKMGQNRKISSFFARNSKKALAEGQHPPQEL